MSKPLCLSEWRELLHKWVHFQVQPAKERHDVVLLDADGKSVRLGAILESAEIAYATEAVVVGVSHTGPYADPGAIVVPEFKGGRLTLTLQLPTPEGIVL